MPTNPFMRPGSVAIRSCCCALVIAAALAGLLAGPLSRVGYARQARTVRDGVYTEAQATRGQAIYKDRCAVCHGDALGGAQAPPLIADDFIRNWNTQPLSALVDKIRNTMPVNDPGQISRPQSADLVAYILKVGRFPGGKNELGSDEAALQIAWPVGIVTERKAPARAGSEAPPVGNLAQVMRGIFFPSSNLIFNAQSHDPGAKRGPAPANPAPGSFSWVDWGAGIYSGWELVDYAAIALAEASPMMLTPGRRCENGRPVPVTDPDWVKFTQEMVDAAKAAYKAAQTRNQETVAEVTGQIADACLHCHEVYRDKRGRTDVRNVADPSNKAARCFK